MTQVVMFPGQGSQKVGMGTELFLRYPDYVIQASDCFGFDLETLCNVGPDELLTRTDNAQAAIFVINALSYMNWLEKNNTPDFVLGHSIGQYNAMLAANMMSYAEGLELVKKRGQLMAHEKNGAMAAVMKISASELTSHLEKIELGSLIDIANDNSEQQTVISGPERIICEVTEALRAEGGFVIPLKTSGAFHSRYLSKTKSEFINVLSQTVFTKPQLKLICNVTAVEIDKPWVALAEHLVSPVKWRQSIYYILSHDEDAEFIECGEGNTLTNMLRYNKKEYAQSVIAYN